MFLICVALLISMTFCIFSVNPIYSLLFLISSFFFLFLILSFLGMEFLSLLVLLVYVGAISILFMFVLMMLNMRVILLMNYKYYYLASSLMLFTFIMLFHFLLSPKFSDFFKVDDSPYIDWLNIFYSFSDVAAIGYALYNFYYFQFLVSSYILLMVMVGSISLVMNKIYISKSQKLKSQLYADMNSVSNTSFNNFNK